MDELCPSCAARLAEDISFDARLAQYLNSIPEEIKTEPDEYLRRLEACLSCGEYYAHSRVCVACGCYVEMRAAKKVMCCPYGGW